MSQPGSGVGSLSTICPPPDPTPTPTPAPTPTPITGTIEPKYIVLTVTYAPPGSASNVTYSNSTMLGSSSSVSSSFQNDVNVSASITTGFSLFGLFGGKTTQTASTQLTQETDSSSTVALNETTTTTTTIRGPSSSALGLDHDEDIIWVWLNPAINLSLNSSTSFVWTGFLFDQNDPAGTTDIIGIPVKFLNGHAAMPSNIADVLARRWAPRTLCTSADPACGVDGTKDPGLDATDLATILQADPFANPSYVINIPSGGSCTADQRFCRTTNTNLQYSPPPPGGQPITQVYTLTHQATATEGQGGFNTYKVSIGTQGSVSGSFFVTLSAKLNIADTVTLNNKWSSTSTNQVGQTATASVTGPSAADNYTGPVEFEIFQDNVYGTFMFGFIPQPTFTLFTSPSSETVSLGNCVDSTVNVSALVSGFNSSVNLTVSGLPQGVTATFSPNPIVGAGSSNMHVCAASTAPVTSSSLTVQGMVGIEAHTTTEALAVTNFTLGASPSSQSVVVGGATSYTVSVTPVNGFNGAVALSLCGAPAGITGTFSPSSISGSGSSTLNISTPASIAPGTYTICVAGTNGALTHTANVALTVNPVAVGDFALSASNDFLEFNAGTGSTSTISVSPLNGFNGTVTLSVNGGGLPASLSSTSVTGSGAVTLTVRSGTSTPAGDYLVTVTGTSGSLSHSITIDVTVDSSGGCGTRIICQLP
ncbi:MAG TPA: hypothetical protein VE783_04980 [Candidatus Limnocylindrales bacterium]|nr:hypothetical protein [Candidatus Limnocylindrales bacterium]